jgi:methylphosphotriester-DNA--protein-cysteine methyltransferase
VLIIKTIISINEGVTISNTANYITHEFIEGYNIARINKDKNYDGKFFFGVMTTGIFCRPSCPSPIAKKENVIYFNDMYEAFESGYRPCLRCMPDMNVAYYSGNVIGRDTGYNTGHDTVKLAVSTIHEGYLNQHALTPRTTRQKRSSQKTMKGI